MKKINWTKEELEKIKEPYIVCENCGWLMLNYISKKNEKCSNCGTKYNDSEVKSMGGDI